MPALRDVVALLTPLVSGVACGGGAATLHPAHVLPEGRVSAGAGVSSTFAFGEGSSAIDRATATTVGTAPQEEQRFLNGVVSSSLLAPGLAPWVGARAGLGAQNEAGATYTGRTIRLDGRHAFGNDKVALSVGAGATGVLMHPRSNPPEAATTDPTAPGGRFTGKTSDVTATGYGLDVPVIVGYRSAPNIVEVWAGVRAGFERIRADLALDSSTAGSEPARASGTRLYGGGLVGAAIGVSPVWVALELDVYYQSLSGHVDFPGSAGQPSERDTTLSGVTLVPSGAIIGKF